MDAQEATAIGRFAVKSAVAGKSDAMVAMRRLDPQKYKVRYEFVRLKVKEHERVLPRRFSPRQNAITQAYRNYVAPLIGDEIRPAEYLGALEY